MFVDKNKPVGSFAASLVSQIWGFLKGEGVSRRVEQISSNAKENEVTQIAISRFAPGVPSSSAKQLRTPPAPSQALAAIRSPQLLTTHVSCDAAAVWGMDLPLSTRSLFSEQLQRDSASGHLLEEIRLRQQLIAQQKKQAQPLIAQEQENPELRAIHETLNAHEMTLSAAGGSGGAYFLKDSEGTTRLVIKAVDEGPWCLNSQQFASPYLDPELRMRETISPYETWTNEKLLYEVAVQSGLQSYVPKTTFATYRHQDFYHFTQTATQLGVDPTQVEALRVPDDDVKLCVVVEYVPKSRPLADFMTQPDQVTVNKIDQVVVSQIDLENVNLLTWIIGDQDANPGNFLLVSQEGQPEHRMIKIDGGLAFGEEKKRGIHSDLPRIFTDQMTQMLSPAGKKLLAQFDVQAIAKKMHTYGKSEASILAFRNRVKGLQLFVQANSSATLADIERYASTHYSGEQP